MLSLEYVRKPLHVKMLHIFISDGPVQELKGYNFTEKEEDATVDCAVCSIPSPDFSKTSWLYQPENESETPDLPRGVVNEGNRLRIEEVYTNHSGSYICVLGGNRFPFEVTVEPVAAGPGAVGSGHHRIIGKYYVFCY